MKRAIIRPENCRSCDICQIQIQCPMSAVIRENSAYKPWIDFYRCSGCLKCKSFCPNHATEELVQPCGGRFSW